MLLANKQVPASFTEKRCAVTDCSHSGCGNASDQTGWRWYPRCWLAVALCTSSPSRPPVPLPFYAKSGDLWSADVFTTRVLLALNRASFQVGILKSVLPVLSPFLLYPCPESEWRRRHWAGQTRLEGGVQPTLGWPWGAQGKWLHFGGPPEIAPARGQNARH